MKLIPASNDSDWQRASKILTAVVKKLDSDGQSLWTLEQISENGLKNTYRLEELYFFTESYKHIGMVFLQRSDPYFWPEISDHTSMFFHKLAILPTHVGEGKGAIAVNLIIDHVRRQQLSYLRVDCDDREKLKRFYTNLGFSFVDKQRRGRFNVVKFELPIDNQLNKYR